MSTLLVTESHLTEQAHQNMPYAKFIGLQIQIDCAQQLLFHVPFQAQNIGNTFLPAIHGGLIGGLIETAALLFVQHLHQSTHFARIIDYTIDYLRPGLAQSMYAQCQFTRQGKRISHLTVSVWQEDAARPIAFARVHCQMPSDA